MKKALVIGGGLAGCEATWQLVQRGVSVCLYEMRPGKSTEAHLSGDLAELVCSNSLGSKFSNRASGLLKEELRQLGSLLIRCADESSLPAGGALAVDRKAFSQAVERAIETHPLVEIIREEFLEIPETAGIIASGPLTSQALTESIIALTKESQLFFFDAIAPIVSRETINMDIAFRASRYECSESEEGDYINCPMNKEEYLAFVEALIDAERIPLRALDDIEKEKGDKCKKIYFEGCLPIEVLAKRGLRALAFGPMRPVGLFDLRIEHRPYAVVQLRQDNLAGDFYNLVGFQTNLKYSEQKRVFRMIPGLEHAEFVRYGQMHRNTFIASPKLLDETMQFRAKDTLFFAGQIVGVEGYVGNIASGLIAGMNLASLLNGEELVSFPLTTMIGALMHYVTHAEARDFQPMKANFGLFPPLSDNLHLRKTERYQAYSDRSLKDLQASMSSYGIMRTSVL